jgi:hypothetical protein
MSLGIPQSVGHWVAAMKKKNTQIHSPGKTDVKQAIGPKDNEWGAL